MPDVHVFKTEQEHIIERTTPKYLAEQWPEVVLRAGDLVVLEPARTPHGEWVMRVTPEDEGRGLVAYRIAAEDVELLVKSLQELAQKANAPAALLKLHVAAVALKEAWKYVQSDAEAERLADAALDAVRALKDHVCKRGEVGW